MNRRSDSAKNAKEKLLQIAIWSWTVTLVLRSFGLPFTGLLYILSTAFCFFSFIQLLWGWFLKKGPTPPYSLALSAIVLLLLQQKLGRSYTGIVTAWMGFILMAFLVIGNYSVLKKITGWTWKMPILLVAALTALLPAGTFHRFFRASTFESYVTTHFSEGDEKAWKLIAENCPIHKDIASSELQEALHADSLREIPIALKAIDKSIDNDPFVAQSYLTRAKIRLLHSELDSDAAIAARKDLTNAIRLDTTLAEAYFYRALAGNYLGYKKRICPDIERALVLDRAFAKHSDGMMQYCQ